jgi:diacylglycerol O-acyltransferase
MSTLSLLDLGFFIAETEASPKHVAGLLICKTPPKAGPGFVKNLYREYLTFTDVKAPFNRVIRFSLKAMPHWEPAASIDLAQHIFYHRLPRGGNDRQALYDFVARLHVPMLDRSRPLWALHVIDGLDGRAVRAVPEGAPRLRRWRDHGAMDRPGAGRYAG